ncbi:MAG: hypothetical protein ACP5HM_07335 [Anaerolineae bacterium]
MTDNTLSSLMSQALPPGLRLRVLTEMLNRSGAAAEIRALRAAVPREPPVSEILAAQYPAGYWMHSDLGISPRYRATAWQLLFLAQLGMGRLPAVERAVEVLLAQNRDTGGAFRLCKKQISCGRSPEWATDRHGRSLVLTAALLWALARLEFGEDPRLGPTWIWLAQRMDDVALVPAAAVWCLRAAVVWGRDDLVVRLVPHVDPPALPDALTFPLALIPDRLAALTALVEAGRTDLISSPARAWLRDKKTPQGWPLERVPGPLWWDPGTLGEPNPWVTLRALRVCCA